MTILEEAAQVVEARGKNYAHPRENYERIAPMWSSILGAQVTPEQIALCMIVVKVSRHCHKPKRDNLVDIAGYARTLEMLDENPES